jgi:lysophospholipase L1-like esterase
LLLLAAMLPWPSVVLLGDSQTQLGWAEGGWVQGLADTVQRRADIVNRGFSGSVL